MGMTVLADSEGLILCWVTLFLCTLQARVHQCRPFELVQVRYVVLQIYSISGSA